MAKEKQEKDLETGVKAEASIDVAVEQKEKNTVSETTQTLSASNLIKQFETLDFNGSDQIIITGLAFSDQDIINFIANLNAKTLVELASLQAMNVPQNTGDLQSASSKKGFTILCKLKIS